MFDDLIRIRTNEEIRRFLTGEGLHPEVIGKTVDNLEILGVRTGGSKIPAIFIKAGSHPDEIGGVYGALELSRRIKTEHICYIVPCTNPFGFQGYNRCLSHLLGRAVKVRDNMQAFNLLKEEAAPIIETEDFALFIVHGIGIVTLDENRTGSSFVERWALNEKLKEQPHLITHLANRYIYFPPEVLYDDGIDPYDHGIKTAYTNWEGWVGNTNRFYDRVDAPVEVACVRDLLKELNPGMVIDMHESGGKSGYPTTGHYLVLPPAWPLHNNPAEFEIALEVLKATRSLGFQPLSREVLKSSWKNAGWNNLGDEFPADGILRSDSRPTMAFYQWGEHYEVSIVIETGMAQPLADRVHIQARAVEAALKAFASAKV